MNKTTRTRKVVSTVAYMLMLMIVVSASAQTSAINTKPKKVSTNKKKSAINSNPERPSNWGVYKGLGRDTGGAVRLMPGALDMTVKKRFDGEEVTVINQNVWMIQDSLSMWCDLAEFRKEAGIIELFEDVIMVDPDRRLEADKVLYYAKTKKSVARGHVKATRDSVILECKQGEYTDDGKRAIFERDMVITDQRRDIVLTGNVGTYNTETKHGQVEHDPVIIRYDSTGAEEARIVGIFMEYDADKGEAHVENDVVLNWDDVVGHCDEAFFYSDDNRVLMVGRPDIVRESEEAIGDSIWIYVTDQVLDSVVVIGSAIAYTASDSLDGAPRSSLTGYTIVMDFDEGKVVRMQSDGQAIGIYHVFDEGEDQGSNKVSGDTVVLMLKDGALDEVNVMGGTEGSFLPPHLASRLRENE